MKQKKDTRRRRQAPPALAIGQTLVGTCNCGKRLAVANLREGPRSFHEAPLCAHARSVNATVPEEGFWQALQPN